MDIVKVQGRDDLVRDKISGAIVSVNKSEYENFISQHRSRLALESRVSSLESKLDKILELLSKEK